MTLSKARINIDDNDLALVKSILHQAPMVFFAYGSRVKNTNRQYSDLDLCYKARLEEKILFKIMDDFVDSDLPFKVNLVDYFQCSKEFRKIIDKDLIEI